MYVPLCEGLYITQVISFSWMCPCEGLYNYNELGNPLYLSHHNTSTVRLIFQGWDVACHFHPFVLLVDFRHLCDIRTHTGSVQAQQWLT